MRLFSPCLMVLFSLCLSVAPLTAQEHGPAEPRDIPRAEWLERALGNSVHYSIDGSYIGREFYLPDGQSVRYEDAFGNCQDGRWTFKDAVYCFAWPGSLVCARHLDLGEGRLAFPSVDTDGTPIPDTMQHGTIVEGGFACGAAVTS